MCFSLSSLRILLILSQPILYIIYAYISLDLAQEIFQSISKIKQLLVCIFIGLSKSTVKNCFPKGSFVDFVFIRKQFGLIYNKIGHCLISRSIMADNSSSKQNKLLLLLVKIMSNQTYYIDNFKTFKDITINLMAGDIILEGNCRYSFNAPSVDISIDKIRNTNSSNSGTIMVCLYNTQFNGQKSNYFGNSKIIASFTLKPLQGGYYYYNIKRTISMENDVTYPWMCLNVSQYKSNGYSQSDIRFFSNTVKPIYRRADTPSSTSTRKNFRIRKAVANGARIVASGTKLIGAAGALIGTVFPPAALIGGAIGAVGSLVGKIFG